MDDRVSNPFTTPQFSNAYPDGIEFSYWTLSRNRIVRDVLNEILPKDPQLRGAVLDIGCGRGIVVGAMREAGIDAWGCEMGLPNVPDNVAPFLITGCDYQNAPAALLDSVHTVMLLDVIEHMDDPVTFLAELRQHIPNLERVVVTVPARKELWSNYDEYYGHYRRYDKSMLEKTLKASGFSIRLNRYFFHMLYWPALLLITLGGSRKVEISAPRYRWLHRLVAQYFYSEYHLFRICGIGLGTSLIAVAELKATNRKN